ncbi:MAG: HigA family addiction module antidote protein [Candidatus Competibacteraceae bacterium]|nr:HigA family addiction module antidote protein [Candidatus Competibacteraceae bacterium]
MITREDLEHKRVDLSEVASGEPLPLIHPGEILQSEFLEPMGITQYRLAKDIGVHPRRVNEIIHGRRAITADTAIRFSRYFDTSARFWMNLQAGYDLDRARAQQL